MSLCKLYPFILAATVAGLAVAGTLSVQIKEYEVPTPRSRPHDPALAPDGSLWYAGQGANKLGRLDPKTGEFKEFPLKTPNSGPHGLVANLRRLFHCASERIMHLVFAYSEVNLRWFSTVLSRANHPCLSIKSVSQRHS